MHHSFTFADSYIFLCFCIS